MEFFTASKERTTVEKPVPAPYCRATFVLDSLPKSSILDVAVVGIYEIYVNGKNITKGPLSPYRSNPTHAIYVDRYDLSGHLREGKNAIALILGNGFSSSVKDLWEFNNNPWNGAPRVGIELRNDGELVLDGSSLKHHDSDVVFDDYHAGEHIDATQRIKDWNQIDCNDGEWQPMLKTEPLTNNLIVNGYTPIHVYETLSPVTIKKGRKGYLYDFGKSVAGMYRLKIKGEKGHTVYLLPCDALVDGKEAYMGNIYFPYDPNPLFAQCDWLTLSGEEDEFHAMFVYQGCRFIELRGLTDEEAKTVSIELDVISTGAVKGSFECDNETVNRVQELVINSDLSNFVHVPTDCPQREKNGWTGDICLSAEQFLLNLAPLKELKVWLQNIIFAQKESGAIPCIVPTGIWGYGWGSGPNWDAVLFELPYRAYLYSGDKEFLEMVSEPIWNYLRFMKSKENSDGLYEYGLEDWCPTYSRTNLEITDSITCKNMCDIAGKIYKELGNEERSKSCFEMSDKIRQAFLKKHFAWSDNPLNTPTYMAEALYYGMYDGDDEVSIKSKDAAIKKLLYFFRMNHGHFDGGILGLKVFFRLLSDMGYQDMALGMIVNDTHPSYKANFLDNGFTTLGEQFSLINNRLDNLDISDIPLLGSFNHHMFGDVSAYFYRYIAGVRVESPDEIIFAPLPFKKVRKANANCLTAKGPVSVSLAWNDERMEATLNIPEGLSVKPIAPRGYVLEAGELHYGENTIVFIKDK